MGSSRAPRQRRREPTVSRKAANDAFVTALFIGTAASFIELGNRVGPSVGLSPQAACLALTILLLIALVPLCERLGGALFNPANNAFLYATGQGSAREHVIRSVAQAVGGVAGALAATTLLPPTWSKGLSSLAVGVRPGVALLEGAACEFVLGSLLAFIVLQSGQLESGLLKLCIPLLATVLAIGLGAEISGPSLNPAFTFAWVFVHPLQTPLEHALVYWVTPVAAGLFGGFASRGYQAFCADRTPVPRRQTQRRSARAKAE